MELQQATKWSYSRQQCGVTAGNKVALQQATKWRYSRQRSGVTACNEVAARYVTLHRITRYSTPGTICTFVICYNVSKMIVLIGKSIATLQLKLCRSEIQGNN